MGSFAPNERGSHQQPLRRLPSLLPFYQPPRVPSIRSFFEPPTANSPRGMGRNGRPRPRLHDGVNGGHYQARSPLISKAVPALVAVHNAELISPRIFVKISQSLSKFSLQRLAAFSLCGGVVTVASKWAPFLQNISPLLLGGSPSLYVRSILFARIAFTLF